MEDTLAFAAFPVFHRKVLDAAWHTLYGIPCTQAVFEHYRSHPAIQKQCLHRIETKRLKNGASLAEALLTALRWECNSTQIKLLEQAIRAFKEQTSDSSPTSFDAQPEATHDRI